MPVTIQLENPCLTAVLDGEIDHHCARSLREEIDQAILDYEPHQLRLDFEKVTFMDSSGIGLLPADAGSFRSCHHSESAPAYPQSDAAFRHGTHRQHRNYQRLSRRNVMHTTNQMKMVFPGISVNERTARSLVAAFLVQLDPTVEELADIRTAVSEAVTNSIVHGYRSQKGDVELHIKILADREVYIRVKDRGCGIPDIEQAMQPLYTTAKEEERAGLGFAVMQSFMDRLQVRSKPNEGTTVIMRKKLRASL